MYTYFETMEDIEVEDKGVSVEKMKTSKFSKKEYLLFS